MQSWRSLIDPGTGQARVAQISRASSGTAQPASAPNAQPQAKPPLSGTSTAGRPAFGSQKPASSLRQRTSGSSVSKTQTSGCENYAGKARREITVRELISPGVRSRESVIEDEPLPVFFAQLILCIVSDLFRIEDESSQVWRHRCFQKMPDAYS